MGGYSKRAVRSYRDSFRVARDKSAVTLLKSGEYRFIKVINNIFCFVCIPSKEPADWKPILETVQQMHAELNVKWISSVS